jgi:hypothetical protein
MTQRFLFGVGASGIFHPRFKGGVSLTDKGYRRIRSGEHRGKYEHRRRIEEMLERPLCAAYVFPERGVIPAGYHVEHADHSRTHNCAGNLMLLDARIHNTLTWATVRYIHAHYDEWLVLQQSKLEPQSVPEWVLDETATATGGAA